MKYAEIAEQEQVVRALEAQIDDMHDFMPSFERCGNGNRAKLRLCQLEAHLAEARRQLQNLYASRMQREARQTTPLCVSYTRGIA